MALGHDHSPPEGVLRLRIRNDVQGCEAEDVAPAVVEARVTDLVVVGGAGLQA